MKAFLYVNGLATKKNLGVFQVEKTITVHVGHQNEETKTLGIQNIILRAYQKFCEI